MRALVYAWIQARGDNEYTKYSGKQKLTLALVAEGGLEIVSFPISFSFSFTPNTSFFPESFPTFTFAFAFPSFGFGFGFAKNSNFPLGFGFGFSVVFAVFGGAETFVFVVFVFVFAVVVEEDPAFVVAGPGAGAGGGTCCCLLCGPSYDSDSISISMIYTNLSKEKRTRKHTFTPPTILPTTTSIFDPFLLSISRTISVGPQMRPMS